MYTVHNIKIAVTVPCIYPLKTPPRTDGSVPLALLPRRFWVVRSKIRWGVSIAGVAEEEGATGGEMKQKPLCMYEKSKLR